MNTVLPAISSQLKADRTDSATKVNPPGAFNDMLTGILDATGPAYQPKTSTAAPTFVGQISQDRPTVSHLLKSDSTLQSETWDILSLAINKDKDFTHLTPGTPIYIDPGTREISWQSSDRFKTATLLPTTPVKTDAVLSENKVPEPSPAESAPITLDSQKSISLGKIDSTNTTVSHLLQNHPQLREKTWDLLADSANQDKPFHRIASGTEIFINTHSREISWNNGQSIAMPLDAVSPAVPITPQHPDSTLQQSRPATDLSEAVKPYFGASYKDINCYELLVKGLDNMEIPYRGKDGLLRKLTSMAREKGMPVNAYLNGEGIVKAAGSLVLGKSYPSMANWQDQADGLMQEIEPLLNKGQILSFSTENRGHTGIVSQQDQQWTFINSGRLDNSVDATHVRRGVGEEVLHKEIRNWFKLAHKRGESLSVTLGTLDQDRIRTAYAMTDSVSTRI